MFAHEFTYFFQHSPDAGELAGKYVTRYRWFFYFCLMSCLRQMYQAQSCSLRKKKSHLFRSQLLHECRDETLFNIGASTAERTVVVPGIHIRGSLNSPMKPSSPPSLEY